LITRILFGGEYRSLSSSLCSSTLNCLFKLNATVLLYILCEINFNIKKPVENSQFISDDSKCAFSIPLCPLKMRVGAIKSESSGWRKAAAALNDSATRGKGWCVRQRPCREHCR
jgi:hypothetical protein